MRPTVKNLEQTLGLDRSMARAIREKLLEAEGSHDAVEDALELVNRVIDAHGVEPVRGENVVDAYYGDIVGLYVNTGDSYGGTVMYDTTKDRFDVTTLGDWVEKNQRRYRIV